MMGPAKGFFEIQESAVEIQESAVETSSHICNLRYLLR